jgi:hypothetical protein
MVVAIGKIDVIYVPRELGCPRVAKLCCRTSWAQQKVSGFPVNITHPKLTPSLSIIAQTATILPEISIILIKEKICFWSMFATKAQYNSEKETTESKPPLGLPYRPKNEVNGSIENIVAKVVAKINKANGISKIVLLKMKVL